MTNTHKNQIGTDICSTMNGHQQNNYGEHVDSYVDHNTCDVLHQNGDVEDTRCLVTDRCNTIAQECAIPHGYQIQMNGDAVHTQAGNTQHMSMSTTQCDEVISLNTQTNGHFNQNSEAAYDSICDRLSFVGMDDTSEHENTCQQTQGCHDEVVGEQLAVFQWTQENLFTQDKDGDTCLHIALILQELNLIMTLINAAISPRSLSTRNNLFQTPLHLAVLTNQIAAVRRLVIGGAEIDSRDRNGNTPLHLAIQMGLADIAATLMEPVRYHETKRNVNYEIPYQKIPQNLEIANYEGKTVLHLAVEGGHDNIVKLLVDKRTDVNSRDGKTGRTVLHNACLDGNVELVKYLLSIKYTNINSKSYDDYTPFDFARIRGHTEIAIILAQAGARNRDDDDYSD